MDANNHIEHENSRAVCAFLLPVYGGNDALLFRRALESIFAQSVNSNTISIYLGVDGPIDVGLESVIKEFSAKIHRVIRSAMCLGLDRNLNALIASLEGEEFVFRMDADDVCLPNRVTLQLNYLKNHPEVGILGGRIQEIDFEGKSLGVRSFPKRAEVNDYIKFACPLAHPTVVFRRSVLNKLGGYPVSGLNEDLQMWFLALEKGIQIDNLDDLVLLYQVDSGFYKRRSMPKAIGEAKAYIIGNYRLHGITLSLLYPIFRLIFRLMPSPIVKFVYHILPIRSGFLNKS